MPDDTNCNAPAGPDALEHRLRALIAEFRARAGDATESDRRLCAIAVSALADLEEAALCRAEAARYRAEARRIRATIAFETRLEAWRDSGGSVSLQ
jgi:hypothetical protein